MRTQVYEGNVDGGAYGSVSCTVCSDGSASCTSTLSAGRSEIIAAHIQKAETGGADGNTAQGPAVVDLCGTRSGAPCGQWTSGGEAREEGMRGRVVASEGAAVLVADMASRPYMYYYNVQSSASWEHWAPQQRGFCRGVLLAGKA